VVPQWISEVLSGYSKDARALNLVAKLSIDDKVVPHFSLSQGVLRYKNRIWIGTNASLQAKLLQACHSTALGGHSGAPVTYRRMKQMFAWRGMKKDVFHLCNPVLSVSKPSQTEVPYLVNCNHFLFLLELGQLSP
jgi:hypothetical protein